MMNIDAKWILDRLPAYRGARSELARAMGVRPEIVTRILNGDRKIHVEEIPAILEFFGVSGAAGPASVPSHAYEGELSPPMTRLLSLLSRLEDAELDFLTVAAEGLVARRNQDQG